MEDFDKILWGFIISISGIVIGWFLNYIGQWFRSRSEDKRSIKLVLYNLLETYFVFVRSDFESYTKKITEKVLEKIPQEERTIEVEEYLYGLYKGVIIRHIKPELQDELSLIESNYQQSIQSLAKIDPITAYYLGGKSFILEQFDYIDTIFKNLENETPIAAEHLQQGAQYFTSNIKPNLYNEAIDELESDIKQIAWQINPVVWYKSRKVIQRLQKNSSIELDKKINDILDSIEEEMKSNPANLNMPKG